jgi:hypothetical protein
LHFADKVQAGEHRLVLVCPEPANGTGEFERDLVNAVDACCLASGFTLLAKELFANCR